MQQSKKVIIILGIIAVIIFIVIIVLLVKDQINRLEQWERQVSRTPLRQIQQV